MNIISTMLYITFIILNIFKNKNICEQFANNLQWFILLYIGLHVKLEYRWKKRFKKINYNILSYLIMLFLFEVNICSNG